jgi:uncharacterized protein (DUF3084 family)
MSWKKQKLQIVWIWDSEMRLGALEYKMDDANKSLEKIVAHMDNQNGSDAVDRQVQFKLMEDRLKQLEKNQERLEKEVLHYAKKFVEKGDRR